MSRLDAKRTSFCKPQVCLDESRAVGLYVCSMLVLVAACSSPEAQLRDATAAGNTAQVEKALEQGVAFDEQDGSGATALLIAAREEHPKILKLLLENHASPHIADKQGRTPLMLAAASGNVEVLGLLKKAGASLSSTDTQGMTAAHYARTGGHTRIADYLEAPFADGIWKGTTTGGDVLEFTIRQNHLVGVFAVNYKLENWKSLFESAISIQNLDVSKGDFHVELTAQHSFMKYHDLSGGSTNEVLIRVTGHALPDGMVSGEFILEESDLPAPRRVSWAALKTADLHNRPPRFIKGRTSIQCREGLYHITFREAVDPDGDPLTYSWVWSTDSTSTLSNKADLKLGSECPVKENIRVTVTDGRGGSVVDWIHLRR